MKYVWLNKCMRKIFAIITALIVGGISLASTYGIQAVDATRIGN